MHILSQVQTTPFFQLMGEAALWSILGIVLLLAGYKVFDYLMPGVHFSNELNKGNIAVAIVIASFFLCLAVIIATVIR